jgi:hypothetical protein
MATIGTMATTATGISVLMMTKGPTLIFISSAAATKEGAMCTITVVVDLEVVAVGISGVACTVEVETCMEVADMVAGDESHEVAEVEEEATLCEILNFHKSRHFEVVRCI